MYSIAEIRLKEWLWAISFRHETLFSSHVSVNHSKQMIFIDKKNFSWVVNCLMYILFKFLRSNLFLGLLSKIWYVFNKDFISFLIFPREYPKTWNYVGKRSVTEDFSRSVNLERVSIKNSLFWPNFSTLIRACSKSHKHIESCKNVEFSDKTTFFLKMSCSFYPSNSNSKTHA